MRFIADFHIHSHFSVATSKDCNPENLHRWAQVKGLTVVGTGDFTHPQWLTELKDKLEPAEEGLYRLKSAPSEDPPLRFVLSGEISSIYKKAGETRKIHNLILLPTFAAAEAINRRLDKIGNIRSDGRPILGLDSCPLLKLVLEECPEAVFIPAHIWTPHFSLFGASSGFDRIEECFEDLTPKILALETGLSSDPPMNWRLSALDRFALVSNSDAHSPRNLAREANLFDTDLSFDGIRSALASRDPKRFLGTLEFFPEEGKYHYDGHRACEVRWKPAQTIAAKEICPKCGKKVTVGVLHRVDELADRPEGVRPEAARHFESLVPLAEIIASAIGMGESSKPVERQYQAIVKAAGSELAALRTMPIDELAKVAGPLTAEGIRRVRSGEVEIAPGYDGEYGTIRVFREGERAHFAPGGSLFGGPPPKGLKRAKRARATTVAESELPYQPSRTPAPKAKAATGLLDALNPIQREAVTAEQGPIIVVAGPGTGKTRTLTCRIAHLIQEKGVPPEHILAVTFTNKASDEMRARLRELLGERAARAVTMGTFHGLCLDALQQRSAKPLTVLDELDSRELLDGVLKEQKLRLSARRIQDEISLVKGRAAEPPEGLKAICEAYQHQLDSYHALDYDDILLNALRLFEGDADAFDAWRRQFPHVLVDEFQDVNSVQYRLVKLWAGDGANLFVIGDPDQAIYGFRGADHRFFDALQTDFPRAQRLALDTSYRCAEPILAAALQVIRKANGRSDVTLRTSRTEGVKPRVIGVASETAEGIAVVHEISRMVGGATMLQSHEEHKGRSFADIAVLFRTGQQADKLEECFLKEGIPYRVVGQRSFLEAKSVREALTFFRCVTNPDDRFRFLQCLSLSRFDPSGKLAQAMKLQADPQTLSHPLATQLKAFKNVLEEHRARVGVERPEQALARWAEEGQLQDDEDMKRLARLAAGFEDMKAFLQRVLLCQEAECERVSGAVSEAVNLMTLHAAKGLEFPVVFIAGVEDGLIPMRKRDSDLDEERRLFYVGLTRAKDDLILLTARSRTEHGKVESRAPSPFLEDIPDGLLEREKVARKRKPDDGQLKLF